MPGWSQIASTTGWPPWTSVKIPAGRPASAKIPASRSVVSGTCSEGLRRKALPPTSACGIIHIGTMSGKLKGTMPATTPSGS